MDNEQQLLQEYAKTNCPEFDTLSEAEKSYLLHELSTSTGFAFYRLSKAMLNLGSLLEGNRVLLRRRKK